LVDALQVCRVRGAVIACALLALTASAHSQSNYPQRPVRMVIPFAPGGASDFVGRIMCGMPLFGEVA